MGSSKTPMVVIRCLAYNHEKYISQCLEGFVKQKTTFPFIAIVHDDASTDKTAMIIKEYEKKYPNIIKPIYESDNKWSLHNGSITKIIDSAIPECVKYEAWCEGDDYWIDPYKLQKQVDFMESNPDYVLCHTSFERSDLRGICQKTQRAVDDNYLKAINSDYSIGTLTVLFRRDAYLRIPKYFLSQNFLMGDYPLWLELGREGKFKYLKDVTAVYRVLANSASHSTDPTKIEAFFNSGQEIKQFYCEKFNLPFHPKSRNLLYERILRQAFDNKDSKTSKKYFLIAKRAKSLTWKSRLFHYCNILRMRWFVYALYLLRSNV